MCLYTKRQLSAINLKPTPLILRRLCISLVVLTNNTTINLSIKCRFCAYTYRATSRYKFKVRVRILFHSGRLKSTIYYEMCAILWFHFEKLRRKKWIEGSRESHFERPNDIVSFPVYLKTYVSCVCVRVIRVLHYIFFSIADVLIYFNDQGLQLILFAHIPGYAYWLRAIYIGHRFTSHFLFGREY